MRNENSIIRNNERAYLVFSIANNDLGINYEKTK